MGLRSSTVFLLIIACLQAHTQQSSSKRISSANSRWTLAWADEFNELNGALPDSAKWVIETGGNGWGNNELQYYTPRPQNVRQENGNLVIEAVKERFTGSDGVTRDYTSARLKTERRFSQRYGRFEARIKVPSGRGMWSAFWMLGDDFSRSGWPACGEIDIMENVGSEPTTIHGTLHGPGYSSANALTSAYSLSNGRFPDGFHIFAAEWKPNIIRFYVDGKLFATKKPTDVPAGQRWVFDHPFFIILDLAVGGNMPGNPDGSTVFPQRMLVDYVRVYTRR